MAARVVTVAFEGVDARRVDVEVQASSGQVAFVVVGLGDKAVAESRERVRAAFAALGLALPSKRLVANLAPADLPKEGSHYDLPIALALMASMGVIPPDALAGWMAFGELGLDGQIAPTAGALPAAIAASEMGLGLICPAACGSEAAWAGGCAYPGAPFPDRGGEPLPGHAGDELAFTRRRDRSAPRPRPSGGERSGARQARVGDRRGRRPQPPVRRAAGVGQVHAGAAAAGVAAAAVSAGVAGDIDGAVRGGAAGKGRADAGAAVPGAAPLGLDGGADRRGRAGQAGGGVPGAQRRPVPRRDAGVQSAGARQPARPAGDRRGDRGAGQPPRALPRAGCSSWRR